MAILIINYYYHSLFQREGTQEAKGGYSSLSWANWEKWGPLPHTSLTFPLGRGLPLAADSSCVC